MMDTIKALLTSKKFITTMIGVFTVLIGKIGWDVPAETLWQVVALIAGFTGSQGLADWAKEKAIIDKVDAPTPGLGNGS